MSKAKLKFDKLDGNKLKIGIVCARWNAEFCEALLASCRQALVDSQVREENIKIIRVPGSYELVYGAARLIKSEKVDAVVCIGTLIKGETMHFEYIAEAVSYGIMKLNVETGKPVIFGVLTCLNMEQVCARSTGENNHGYDWGRTAVEMALL